MRASWAEAGREPALDELLTDPIVALLMRRDRIAETDVLSAVRAARRRLARRPRRTPASQRDKDAS